MLGCKKVIVEQNCEALTLIDTKNFQNQKKKTKFKIFITLNKNEFCFITIKSIQFIYFFTKNIFVMLGYF